MCVCRCCKQLEQNKPEPVQADGERGNQEPGAPELHPRDRVLPVLPPEATPTVPGHADAATHLQLKETRQSDFWRSLFNIKDA